MTTLMLMIICAVLYAIKGGQHKKARIYIEHMAGIQHYANGDPIGDMTVWQWIVHRLVDGKVLSALLFGILAMIVTSEHISGIEYKFQDGAFWFFVSAVTLWLVAVSPKMGRIVGMIGGYKGNWDEDENPYDNDTSLEKAIEGWKAGIMRGVWIGAMMAIVFWNPIPIITGALFPVTAWAGVSFEQWRTGMVAASWHWHEWLCGGMCIGLGISLTI